MNERRLRGIYGVAAALVVLGASGGACIPQYPPASCTEHGGVASEITKNHGHQLRIPPSDFVSVPDAGTYSIRGGATHDHQITVPGQNLRIVSDFNSYDAESTNVEGHTHVVTVDCSSY